MEVESICLGDLSTNCYLVSINGKTILIDPAEPSKALFSFLGSTRVDMVVNTHGHFDHVGGNWAVQRRGAELFLHRADLPLVDHFYPGHPPVNRYLNEGDRLAGLLTVFHVPGHSPGSVAFVGQGVLFSGDLLFAGSIGRTDLPGGSTEEMETSLRRICALPDDYRVYPGHGGTTTLGEEKQTNPFLIDLR